MNKLSADLQATVIGSLVEGTSIRSVERMTGIHRDTIMRLMVRIGGACGTYLDANMRGLTCKRLELDEIWCFVGKKQRHVTVEDNLSEVGDFWTWVAIDAETKLIPSYRVGKRDLETGKAFVGDLASRLTNRVQISSDGLKAYVEAVEASFGADVDYAQIVKSYEAESIGPGRYSPPKVVSAEKTLIVGNPDKGMVSTSFVERQNLTMRMQMRRFTRLTNGFSKKVDNLRSAVGLHFAWYNYVRPHATLKTTPAVAAGISDHKWSIHELVDMANSN